MDITQQRAQRFKEVIRKRQWDLTVVLENVHDPHNIGAVLRTCDAVGISEIFVLYTETQLTQAHFQIGKSSSTGAGKWIDTHFFKDHHACFNAVSEKYSTIIATAWEPGAVKLFDLDLSKPSALVFGNEHDGVSRETIDRADACMIIPQAGMVQSLNISVACAVSLYEAMRQRSVKGLYDEPFDPGNLQMMNLYKKFISAHHQKRMNKIQSRSSQKQLK